MAEYIWNMANSVKTLVQAISNSSNVSTASKELTDTILEALKNDVQQNLSHTNSSIDELKALIMYSLSQICT